MCGIYCVYKQSRSCQLPFCASPIFHFEIGDFSVYIIRRRTRRICENYFYKYYTQVTSNYVKILIGITFIHPDVSRC